MTIEIVGTTGGQNTSAATFAVTIPTHQADDWIIVFFNAVDNATPTSVTAGWDLVRRDVISTSGVNYIYARKATGAGTTFSIDANERVAWRVWVIRGLDAALDLATIQALTGTVGPSTATSATFANITGLTASVEYVSLAMVGGSAGDGRMTSAPSGWSNLSLHQSGTTDSHAVVSTADRIITGVTSLQPGSAPLEDNDSWRSYHMVLPGASGPVQYDATGTVAAASTAGGAVTLQTSGAGTVPVASTVTGAGTRFTSVTGAVAAVSAVTGSAVRAGAGQGTVTVTSTVTADVTVIPGLFVGGTVTASSTVAGSVTKRTPAAGTVTSAAVPTLAVVKRTNATGTVSLTSTASATMRLRQQGAGVVSIFSGVTGAIKAIEAPALPPTQLMRPFGTLSIGALTIKSVTGSVSLNAGRVPYAMATVEAALTDPDDIETLDPRDTLRGLLTGGDDYTGASRVFNLGLRSRTVNHANRTVSLELASDEAQLIDYAPLTTDNGARTHEASLRAVCNYVLGKIGASLAAGTADANVTAAWNVTNLLVNPSFEVDASGWVQGGNGQSVVTSTNVAAAQGTRYLVYRSVNPGAAFLNYGTNIRVDPGRVYTFTTYQNPETTARPCGVMIRFKDADGNTIRDNTSTMTSIPGDTWTRVSHTIGIPPGVAQVSLHVRQDATASNQAHRVDGAMFYQGNEVIPYFDGAKSADSLYAYVWDNAANASTSQRIPVVDRTPEMFEWTPGVSAWEFLAPITTSAGLKLFCDENRVWRLVDPAAYSVSGLLTMSAFNTYEGTDTIDRANADSFCTGVVVKYRWIDNTGVQREATDSAGVPGKVLVWEFDRPYPGPGAAAAILARRVGAGRVQDVTALADWSATPGMEARISLPSTIDQQGTLSAVTWDLETGYMDAETSNLLDAPPDSWLGFDPAPNWADIPNTTDHEWRDY
jgi:hypothetical protein